MVHNSNAQGLTQCDNMLAIPTECNIQSCSIQYSVNVGSVGSVGSRLQVWQSRVDIEHYSVLCIKHNTMFQVLYQ